MESKAKNTTDAIRYSIWDTRTHAVNKNVINQLRKLSKKETTTQK